MWKSTSDGEMMLAQEKRFYSVEYIPSTSEQEPLDTIAQIIVAITNSTLDRNLSGIKLLHCPDEV